MSAALLLYVPPRSHALQLTPRAHTHRFGRDIAVSRSSTSSADTRQLRHTRPAMETCVDNRPDTGGVRRRGVNTRRGAPCVACATAGCPYCERQRQGEERRRDRRTGAPLRGRLESQPLARRDAAAGFRPNPPSPDRASPLLWRHRETETGADLRRAKVWAPRVRHANAQAAALADALARSRLVCARMS